MSPPRPCEMTNRNKNNKTGFDNLGCSNIINTIRTTFQTRYFSVPKSVWICQLEDFGICQFPNPFYTKFSSHCDCTSFQINAWNVLRLFFIQVRFFCWWSPLKKVQVFYSKGLWMMLGFSQFFCYIWRRFLGLKIPNSIIISTTHWYLDTLFIKA